MLDRHVNRLPLLRLFVKQQGKSHALNAVIERLQEIWYSGPTTMSCSTDRWLASYVDAARAASACWLFGGPIIPRFLGGEPDWRPAWEFVNAAYGLRDWGAEPFDWIRTVCRLVLTGRSVPLQKKYAYRTELGRRGELVLTNLKRPTSCFAC